MEIEEVENVKVIRGVPDDADMDVLNAYIPLEEMAKLEIVIFITESGNTIVRKNRYGVIGKVMNAEPDELPTCPFCGEHAVVVSHPGQNWDGSLGKGYNVGGMHELWYVGCPSEFFEGLVKECEIKPSASWFADLEKAKNAWKQRACKCKEN